MDAELEPLVLGRNERPQSTEGVEGEMMRLRGCSHNGMRIGWVQNITAFDELMGDRGGGVGRGGVTGQIFGENTDGKGRKKVAEKWSFCVPWIAMNDVSSPGKLQSIKIGDIVIL